jgi:hypothetical protein
MMQFSTDADYLPLFVLLHMAGMIACAIGVVFFLAWAIRTLKAEQLKLWSWWLIGVGIVICLLTLPFAHFGGNVRYQEFGEANFNGGFGMMQAVPGTGFPMMRTFVNTWPAGDATNGSAATSSKSSAPKK